jgi:uncharacterized protein YndB with AHSA1/START domain
MDSPPLRPGIEIGAPPQEIWPWLVTPALLDRWSAGRIALEPDPRFPAPGAWAVLHLRAGGASTWRARVVTIEPPRRVVFELEGFQALQGVRATLRVELEEWLHSTWLRWAVDLPFRGSSRQMAAALGARLSGPWTRLLARRLLRSLREAVEGPEGTRARERGLL